MFVTSLRDLREIVPCRRVFISCSSHLARAYATVPFFLFILLLIAWDRTRQRLLRNEQRITGACSTTGHRERERRRMVTRSRNLISPSKMAERFLFFFRSRDSLSLSRTRTHTRTHTHSLSRFYTKCSVAHLVLFLVKTTRNGKISNEGKRARARGGLREVEVGGGEGGATRSSFSFRSCLLFLPFSPRF